MQTVGAGVQSGRYLRERPDLLS